MKKIILFIVVFSTIINLSLQAQVAINNDGSIPDGSAMLDVKSNNSGLLLPRLNTAQIINISNPAAGLMVFNTDSLDFYGFNGNEWISVWNVSDTIPSVWSCGYPIIDSRDGQAYETAQIGTQCWMAENLNIGTRIDVTVNQSQNTPTEIIEKYCYNDEPDSCVVYGGLYQWDEMMQYVTTEGAQGICPTGWYLASDDEWKTLEIHLGMSQIEADGTSWRGTNQGEQMKSTSGWYNNGNGTNSSGFTGLPGGYRHTNGNTYYVGQYGYWRSSTESDTDAWERGLAYGLDRVSRDIDNKEYGASVRCIKD